MVNVRAVVRYMYGEKEMSPMLRLFAAHLFSQPGTPYHHFAAFVQLAVRYPALVCVARGQREAAAIGGVLHCTQ